jgi:hypothetical protein
MKPEKPRAKFQLGQTGTVGSRDDEKSDAREIFLKTIEQHAPQVLEDLRQQVYDRWTAHSRDDGTTPPEYLSSRRAWAIRWNLTWNGQPADWIAAQLDSTFSDWKKMPNLVGKYWGTFPGSHEHRPVVELFPIAEALMVCTATPDRGSPSKRTAVGQVLKEPPELHDEYLGAPSSDSQVITCMPTANPLPQIRNALRQLQKNVQKALRHTETERKFRQYLGAESSLKKARAIDKERFVWAVRFQCLGHNFARIAASRDSDWIERDSHWDDAKLDADDCASPAIASGVREILRLIELTPRSNNKTGLPNT